MTSQKKSLFRGEDQNEIEHKLIRLLLDAGADSSSIKTKENKSPFSLAFEHGMSDLLALFGKAIDLNKDPRLFFLISPERLLSTATHD